MHSQDRQAVSFYGKIYQFAVALNKIKLYNTN